MLRDVHRARMVFGANLSCVAASSVVRRFDSGGIAMPAFSMEAKFATGFFARIRGTDIYLDLKDPPPEQSAEAADELRKKLLNPFIHARKPNAAAE